MRVLGYRVQSGISKKGEGDPYSMGAICLAVAVENMKTKNTTVSGKGAQGVEMPLTDEGVAQLEKVAFPPGGVELDLLLDQKAFFGELKTVCVGVRSMPKAA